MFSDGVANIFKEDTDINVIKSWLAGASNGATWPILDRFLPRIHFKDWTFDEIEAEIDTIIGPCLYLKIDDITLDDSAKTILDGLNSLIDKINENPSKFFKNAQK